MKSRALVACFLAVSFFLSGQSKVDLNKLKWIHGAQDCSQNSDPYIQIVRYDKSTWIFRQNKCVHYEAPFIYLFVGKQQALLVDTGAKAPEGEFPLYEAVTKILADTKTPILKVIHSHTHGDHKAGDYQFKRRQGVQLIGPTRDSIALFLQITHWPEQLAEFDLGKRKLTIIPIPGHDQASVAIYDSQTKWLLTGDTVYPGRLYVRDWPAFKASVARMLKFSETHPISFLMGNHLEMTKTPGVDYPVGTKYQPNEQILPMKVSVLRELNQVCLEMGENPRREVRNDFIIEPVK